jgi:hypothetical protein
MERCLACEAVVSKAISSAPFFVYLHSVLRPISRTWIIIGSCRYDVFEFWHGHRMGKR